MRGVVKFFDSNRAFGFISPADGSKDLFFHQDNVSDFAKLRQDDMVSFDAGEGRDGRPRALNVRLAR